MHDIHSVHVLTKFFNERCEYILQFILLDERDI